MSVTVFHGLWTAALLVTFIAIVAWAWSGKRKQGFDAAARMPLDDEDEPRAPGAGSERNPNG